MLTFITPGWGAIKPLHLETHKSWTRSLTKAGYLVEPWRCDLASGAFIVGLRTLALLGARQNPCGIVDLVRAYDRSDRPTILNILEQASATPSSFCFSTIIRGSRGRSSRLYCIGNSTLSEHREQGCLRGIFAVPRQREKICA
ncbi:hypothetical protein PYH37_002998 [Sinorhizobium numidicum]|uniref:Uncharacterized protein n=1 Tax=Sinorhizobium numidicum TaxID=680248 RepID=A0ABY8D368_9HYPH|nr:hypothetical protein [Sinorhizobium numidicum]WEX78143.1 hypothetical protein PYH37_002998 [Sinorhizobium numidicum]WEX84802.1 hypothetical protein PYH38_003711 [Sinorhizobium numidicum]